MDATERKKRQALVDCCLKMNSSILNQGTSGNISIRHENGLLITPTSLPYERMGPEDIVFLDAESKPHGRHKPSSEWRFHRDILAARPEMNVVLHAHPIFATALAILGRHIPPIHYMMAVFGGTNVRCAPYAIYGSQQLSELAVEALVDRKACLMAHHGIIALGTTVENAFWRAVELETLAHQYHACLQIEAEPKELSAQQIQNVIDKIDGYGLIETKRNLEKS